jgi:hypothetical protein
VFSQELRAGLQRKGEGNVMAYFLLVLAGFAAWSGASDFALGGLPLPGTLRMASKTSGAYIASRVIGLNPARWIRLSTVLGGRSKILDISVKVNPSISLIIGLYQKIIEFCRKNQTFYLANV